ncbi:MAG: HPF/RaiA family ribosome-associated protein [Acidobacteria bacterium]|nr:HPF/RaiA family ribosome-associated protein [Acidobacteriota bacterium]MCG3194304.1 Ribosome hibernation promotion factor [Thermoanaerobaculia bacterium]MCK6681916.1 HPF/RaiA family ribosome-associated protein [Thermoanaerobaculia bacterium]
MNIDFTARRVKIDPVVRDLVEKKLQKLVRVLPPDAQAHVIVWQEKKSVCIEITIVGRQRTWTANESGPDQETVAHLVLERIVNQVKKAKSRVKEDKKSQRAATVRTPEVWKTEPKETRETKSEKTTVRHEKISLRPMFEEDALHLFTSEDRQILVFRLPADDSLRVLYRRRDGSIGLLIPS